jgi:predicted dithiol-disulfide oxidoreductase (DUF899 family)
MVVNKVVGHDEWVAARKRHLTKEKEFTRLRDQLSRERRELPWELVEKDYVFEGADGPRSLSDIFAGRSQLVVYHAMFNPDTAGPNTSWTVDAACSFCSFWMDNFNGVTVHLNHRDITMVAVSRAAYPAIAAYKKRMGWSFPWYSSGGSDFNLDCDVSYSEDQLRAGPVQYNYASINGTGPSSRASASSSRTRRARSFTPIRPTHAASTCSMSPITTWTWGREAATRATEGPYGSGVATSIQTDGGNHSADCGGPAQTEGWTSFLPGLWPCRRANGPARRRWKRTRPSGLDRVRLPGPGRPCLGSGD